jgi:hypothetical protein
MKVLLYLTFVLLVPPFISVAAAAVDDDTTCETVNSVMETSAPGSKKAKEIVLHVRKTMKALDRTHGLEGKHQIFPKMTKSGQSALALFAASRCKVRPELTLTDTAVETYEAVRATHANLGAKKLKRREARSGATRQSASPPRPNRPEPDSLARIFGDL